MATIKVALIFVIAAMAQGGAEAAQPKALPMAEEDDVTE